MDSERTWDTHSATQHDNSVTTSMVTKQNPRRKFDVKFKEDVLRYAAEHSGEKAAKHFGVDSRQVRYWKKQKDELLAEPDNKRLRLPGGGRKKASNEMETQLSDWLRSMQRNEHGRGVSRRAIQNKAKEIYLTVSDGGKEFAASNGWLQKFLRRNGPVRAVRRRTNPTVTRAQKRNNPDYVASRPQVHVNCPEPSRLISVKEEDAEDQPDLNQCVESRQQVTTNAPDSSKAISIKKEDTEDHQLSASILPYQVPGQVFDAEIERSVQLPHPSYDIYFDDSDETQLSQGSRHDHFAVQTALSQQQPATGSGQLVAGTGHKPADTFEQSVLHCLEGLREREESRLEMDTHHFMHFVGLRMDKLNATKKAKLQLAIHQALLDAERSDSD